MRTRIRKPIPDLEGLNQESVKEILLAIPNTFRLKRAYDDAVAARKAEYEQASPMRRRQLVKAEDVAGFLYLAVNHGEQMLRLG